MLSPFRKKHLYTLLDIALKSRSSLDFNVHSYFRENRSLGSKDRLAIKQGVYEIFKWKLLLNHCHARTTDELIDLYDSDDSPIGLDNSNFPSHARVGFPKWLFDKINTSLGYKEALDFCMISNGQAPITIRVNTNKCDPKAFYRNNKNLMELTKCEFAKNGFHVGKKMQFKAMDEFLDGHFEIQDEASQIIGDYVNAKENQHILDYCAASGGKTLAFAPDMHGKGQVHLHDIRRKPLVDAKKRLNRAGIQNFQIYFDEEKRIRALKGNMDTVLVDAPCSCTGTLRRRPDQKLALTEAFLEEITKTQKEILLKAIPYVKSGGNLIYATCSILKEENEDQTEFLKGQKELTFVTSRSIPLKYMGSDSMYLSVFKKNSLV